MASIEAEILDSARIATNIYALGNFEKNLTVYRQQVRALNLAWALFKEGKSSQKVAIVGGGVSGLTLAAGLATLVDGIEIHLYERCADLCPMQQGCELRWLHPRIYDWPDDGCLNPSAELPLLNWQEGRASDVAHQILRSFARIFNPIEQLSPINYKIDQVKSLKIHVEVKYLRINSADCTVDWLGSKTRLSPDGFLIEPKSGGGLNKFDAIIIAAGFGLEKFPEKYLTPSYWRNDIGSQVGLDHGVPTYLISGYGDGALVDIFRLSIQRYRQDRIANELFDHSSLLEFRRWKASSKTLLEVLRTDEGNILQNAVTQIGNRIRRDTRVVGHFGGSGGDGDFKRVFEHGRSSFFNKLLLYLLYRAGGFYPAFGTIEETIKEFDVPAELVFCRHGVKKTVDHLKLIFADWENVKDRIEFMSGTPSQRGIPLWELGAFRLKQESIL